MENSTLKMVERKSQLREPPKKKKKDLLVGEPFHSKIERGRHQLKRLA